MIKLLIAAAIAGAIAVVASNVHAQGMVNFGVSIPFGPHRPAPPYGYGYRPPVVMAPAPYGYGYGYAAPAPMPSYNYGSAYQQPQITATPICPNQSPPPQERGRRGHWVAQESDWRCHWVRD